MRMTFPLLNILCTLRPPPILPLLRGTTTRDPCPRCFNETGAALLVKMRSCWFYFRHDLMVRLDGSTAQKKQYITCHRPHLHPPTIDSSPKSLPRRSLLIPP